MKILVIGDPHGSEKVKKIPVKNVDLILITGDLGKADLMREMAFKNIERKKKGLPEIEYSAAQEKKAFMQAYNSSMKIVKYFSKFAPVFLIGGNVESTNVETKKFSKELGIELPLLYQALNSMKNVRVINNRVANFKGVRIGGLPYFVDVSWVREFKPSEYNKSLKNAKKASEKSKRILNNFGKVDVLLCHQPPYGILDKVNFKGAPKHWQGKSAGSKVILDYVKKKKPEYVFCGHIHEGKGKKKVGETSVYNVGCAGDYVLVEIK